MPRHLRLHSAEHSDDRGPFVTIGLRCGTAARTGVYFFEATINQLPCRLEVTEAVAFDYLGLWTRDVPTCVEVLRSHKFDLARRLSRKVALGARPDGNCYVLDQDD